jgi:hypothetical protein
MILVVIALAVLAASSDMFRLRSDVADAQATQTPADQDFANRCSAPGVLRCYGFDNTTTDIVQGVTTTPGGDGKYYTSLDTTIKASGAGSLRMELRNDIPQNYNLAGNWSPQSNDALGSLFSQNSTFYVQFRQRFSPEMLTNKNSTTGWRGAGNSFVAWKQVIFQYNQTSCANIELTTHTYHDTDYPKVFPVMYTACGSGPNSIMTTTLDRSSYAAGPPFLNEQGSSNSDGYNCQYGNYVAGTGNGSGCYFYEPNKWLTFYYRIHIGTWGSPNSQIQAWIAKDGGPYKQFINVPNMILNHDGNPALGYNNLTFTTHMTGNQFPAAAIAYTWYDELIASTQPIAAPQQQSAGIPPAAPSNLRVQ